MTKKHFQRLAYELMSARPNVGAVRSNGQPVTEAEYRAWIDCVHAVAKACAQSNPAFDSERFTLACVADSYSPSMHGR